jgi:transcriptional regulator GlxA family with amidase domain
MPVFMDMVVFDGVDELDVVGPVEVLRRAAAIGADVQVRLCSRTAVSWVSGSFGMRFQPDAEFKPGDAEVVIVPGGGWVARSDAGAWAEVRRGQWLPLLSEAAGSGSVMAGVCTGVLLLAHAGVIGARRATTHHDARADLAALGATVVAQRVVDEGTVVTSGGVTSGIDLALFLTARYFGESVAAVIAEGLEYPWSATGPRPSVED